MPTRSAIWGGSAYVAIIRAMADHTGIANKTTGVVIASPTISDAALVLKDDGSKDLIVETTEISFDDSGIPSFKVTTSDPEALDLIKIASPRTSAVSGGATRNEKTSENGLKIGGAGGGSSNPPYVIIYAEGTSDGDVMTAMMIANIKGTSGGRSSKAGDVKTFTLELTGIGCKKSGGLELVQGLFDATVFNATISAGLRTIAQNSYIQESFIPGP